MNEQIDSMTSVAEPPTMTDLRARRNELRAGIVGDGAAARQRALG